MNDHERISPQSIISQAEKVRDEWGDGGCWSEVITGAKQRANLLHLYSEEEQSLKFHQLSGILSQIHGHHDVETAKRLCEELESIIPLSSK